MRDVPGERRSGGRGTHPIGAQERVMLNVAVDPLSDKVVSNLTKNVSGACVSAEADPMRASTATACGSILALFLGGVGK
jgi:hypothetical protein